MTIPESALPTANDLYQMALDMGASAPLAGYLVGSAYQESSFNPKERGDFVGGKPTSFGLMQVGSPSLGSGSVQDQFKNYIARLQSNAPETWSAMNAAPTPEAAYAAQHANPDWRMGIPGNRFAYARQVLGAPGWQQIAGELGGPAAMPPAQIAATTAPAPEYAYGRGSNPAQMSTGLDYAKALMTPTTGQVAGSAISSLLSGVGQAISGGQQQGGQQAMQMMQRPSQASQILRQLLNPGNYPDYSSYLGG